MADIAKLSVGREAYYTRELATFADSSSPCQAASARTPKSRAGIRMVSFPAAILPELQHHLDI